MGGGVKLQESMRELERAYATSLKGAAIKIHAAVDRLMYVIFRMVHTFETNANLRAQ